MKSEVTLFTSADDGPAQDVSNWCMFCGNCCNMDDMYLANYCMKGDNCDGKTKAEVVAEMEDKKGGEGGEGNGKGKGKGKGKKSPLKGL